MPDTMIQRGSRKTVMAAASRAPGTFNSDAYALLNSNGIIITVSVTDVGSSGSLDTLSVQAEDNGNYDTIATFATLAITATGRYRFRIAPGSSRAAGANAFKGAAEDSVPATGRVQAVHTTGTMIYSIKVEGV